MKDRQFQARAKKVQKLGRDGLVEQDRATGEEQRVSQRTADVSFGPERPAEPPAAAHTPSRRRKQPRPTQAVPPTEPVRDTAAESDVLPASEPPPLIPAKKSTEVPRELVTQDVPPPRPGRLRFEDGSTVAPPSEDAQPTPEREAAQGDSDAQQQPPPASQPPSLSPRQQRHYSKAERRVAQASSRLEKAQAKLPAKRRIRLAQEYDSEAGKVRHHLQFEREAVPADAPPALPKRAGGALVRTAGTSAALKAHQKLREAERDNVGVESAHKGEFAAERTAGRLLRWNKRRQQAKPYQEVRQARGRLEQERSRLAWRTAVRDQPELRRGSALSKWSQRKRIKRGYAQAAHGAQKTTQHTQTIFAAAGKAVRTVIRFGAAHKVGLGIAAALVLVFAVLMSVLMFAMAMLSGAQSTYLSATYLAAEEDICESDLYYTELETDLQMDIDGTEANHPGYDEYRFSVGEIGHDPYELMGYLSAAYNAFTFAQVQGELDRLFGEQYTLTRESVTEIRYDTENNPYEWTVLKTTLTVRPLSEIIADSLPTAEQADRYAVYMQTLGGRQTFSQPFDFPWLDYVTSGYGWRVHPISGEKSLHRGIDIAVAQGTPILAVQAGRVVSAGDAGGYGLCVVIEDDQGNRSRYAHCSSFSVTVGQEVQPGDVIAAVGSTGQSTGPHLHLEVLRNGEYLNPSYFVNTGSAPFPVQE